MLRPGPGPRWLKYFLPSPSERDTLLTDTVFPQNILFPGTTFLSVRSKVERETHLQRSSVWRLEIDVAPTPDGSADVDGLAIDNPLAVESPARTVHEVALVVPVKPLAGELMVLVSPLGLDLGDVVQAAPVL